MLESKPHGLTLLNMFRTCCFFKVFGRMFVVLAFVFFDLKGVPVTYVICPSILLGCEQTLGKPFCIIVFDTISTEIAQLPNSFVGWACR